MYKRKRVTAVILAAGNGSRMGIPTNKVRLPLDERQIVEHALAAFERHPYVDDLILVARAGEEADLQELAQTQPKPTRIVTGGATR
ncbi:MAG: 2-C-methyl-D-erythritol 4-phosphate cytidylyltransferase, partial [Oscillospiraceae bacterium]|nr:2-C-methyl-D-erythritol 4-phosphate cytidylyltransferase [Oscillospiraceae bacterium]